MKNEWNWMIEDRRDCYQYLEDLRKSGRTNMFGASPYLASHFGLTEKVASDILIHWMENYDTLLEEGIITRR